MPKVIQPFDRKIRPAANGRKYSLYPAGNPPLTMLSLVTGLIQVVEGSSTTVTVSRTGSTSGAVAVDWVIAEVGATPQSGTLTWADGDGANKSVAVLAGLVEATSSGSVTLSNARRTDGGDEQPVLGVSSGSFSILNDPGIAGTITLVTTALTVQEGNNVTITASRTSGSTGAVAVDYTVAGVTTTPQSGSLAWANGDSANKNATVLAGLVASNTTGSVTLSNARRTDGGSPAPLLGTSSGSLTVTDSPVILPSWNLPATINVAQSGTTGLRQYLVNGTGLTIVVTNLPAGVTYNSGLERLEGAASGTSSGTVTFTAGSAVATATVALVEPASGYTIANAIAGLPFAVNIPAAPTITSEVTVTPATIAANKVNGRRIILTAGSYGDQGFSAQDQEIILQDGVIFGNVNFGTTARRIVMRNEVPRSGNMTTINFPEGGNFTQDVLIDGIRCDNGGNRNHIHGDRIAIINSFIRTVDYPLASVNDNYNDIIIGNCDLQAYGSMQAGVRLQGVNRLVFVDNRISKTGSGHNAYRLHGHTADMDYSYTARNQFEGPRLIIAASGDGSPPQGHFQNVWFLDNVLYMTPGGTTGLNTAADYSSPQEIVNMVLTNNVGYGITAYWTHPDTNSYPGWTISGNTIGAYVSPPAWEFA